MKSQTLNLFIVDDDKLTVANLRIYLEGRFGTNLNISTFDSGAGAIQCVNQDTDIVILDYALPGENGNAVLKLIKTINPKTEVIMLSSNDNMAVAIESFRNGAADYVIKGEKDWKKITSLVYKIITYPVRMMVQEFGINKYIAMFLVTFVIMGVGVSVALRYIH